MSNNSLSFLTSYFLVIPTITALPLPWQPNAPTLPITAPALLSNHVEALIREARAQAKMLRYNAEREARATAVVVVRPFRDSDKSFLAWGQKYRLGNPYQALMRRKVEHSGFVTLNNQRFGSKFVEEVANLSDSESRWMTQSYLFCISVK